MTEAQMRTMRGLAAPRATSRPSPPRAAPSRAPTTRPRMAELAIGWVPGPSKREASGSGRGTGGTAGPSDLAYEDCAQAKAPPSPATDARSLSPQAKHQPPLYATSIAGRGLAQWGQMTSFMVVTWMVSWPEGAELVISVDGLASPTPRRSAY